MLWEISRYWLLDRTTKCVVGEKHTHQSENQKSYKVLKLCFCQICTFFVCLGFFWLHFVVVVVVVMFFLKQVIKNLFSHLDIF